MSKRLSLEETKENLVAWRENNDEGAFIQLAKYNQHLVRYIANRYISCGLPKEDVLSAGKLGLIRSINEFDYENKDISNFKLCALNYIESQIQMEAQLDYEQKKLLASSLSNIEDQTIEIEIANVVSEPVKGALQELTLYQREFVILKYVSQMSTDDIENILNGIESDLESGYVKANKKVK